MLTVGIMSAGAMGSAVGAGYLAGGARVVTSTGGRSARTHALAEAAGLELLSDLEAVVAASDIVFSIVPPGRARQAASAFAAAVAQVGAAPLLVEANAISPATLTDIARCVAEDSLVDGSISGGPPGSRDTTPTRLYLSGGRAADVAAGSNPWLDVRVVGSELGTASAVKMCTASIYKGRAALLAHALLTAQAHGVLDHVLDDLGPGAGSPRGVAVAGSKAWRFVDEMREIAATQRAAGLPGELFDGVAAAYAGLTGPSAPEDVPAELDWATALAGLR